MSKPPMKLVLLRTTAKQMEGYVADYPIDNKLRFSGPKLIASFKESSNPDEMTFFNDLGDLAIPFFDWPANEIVWPTRGGIMKVKMITYDQLRQIHVWRIGKQFSIASITKTGVHTALQHPPSIILQDILMIKAVTVDPESIVYHVVNDGDNSRESNRALDTTLSSLLGTVHRSLGDKVKMIDLPGMACYASDKTGGMAWQVVPYLTEPRAEDKIIMGQLFRSQFNKMLCVYNLSPSRRMDENDILFLDVAETKSIKGMLTDPTAIPSWKRYRIKLSYKISGATIVPFITGPDSDSKKYRLYMFSVIGNYLQISYIWLLGNGFPDSTNLKNGVINCSSELRLLVPMTDDARNLKLIDFDNGKILAIWENSRGSQSWENMRTPGGAFLNIESTTGEIKDQILTPLTFEFDGGLADSRENWGSSFAAVAVSMDFA